MSFPDFDLAIDYLQFGGGYQPGDGAVRPFVAASVGLTRYGSNPGEVENMIGVSGSLGGGFSVPMGKRLAFRFEVLGYATIDDAAIAVSCGPGCVVRFSGGRLVSIRRAGRPGHSPLGRMRRAAVPLLLAALTLAVYAQAAGFRFHHLRRSRLRRGERARAERPLRGRRGLGVHDERSRRTGTP